MFNDAVAVALFIQFVNSINDMKCIGLRKANHDLSVLTKEMKQDLGTLLSATDTIKRELYYRELYVQVLCDELDDNFNMLFNRSLSL